MHTIRGIKGDDMKINYSEILDYWDTQKPIRNGKTLHAAIGKAIEKQIPKKPTIKGTEFVRYTVCPNCQTMIMTSYCPECGQAIDWRDYD